MRSNNRLGALGAALALSGCSSAWWRDPPAADAATPPSTQAPVQGAMQPGYSGQPYAGAPQGGDPMPSDWSAQQGGAAYPPPYGQPQPQPAYRPDTPYEQPRYQPTQPTRPERAPAQPDYVPPTATPRYDNVGYAAYSSEAGTVAGAHATLPPGSFVEVTSLDTGRTILVPITAAARSGREIELSGAAAQELGLSGYGGEAPVRVRATNPTGADLGALRLGRPAPARPDTPPVLLNALRKKLDGTLGQVGAPSPPAYRPGSQPSYQPPGASYGGQQPPAGYVPSVPATRPGGLPPTTVRRPAPAAPARSGGGAGYYVQVAALADAARAQSLARQVGGAVVGGGGVSRVRFGPFEDLRTAQAARDDIAARGYGDARIVRQD